MSATVPTTEPTTARAGDTWQWRREDLADFPASSWTLKYYFRNAASGFDVTATADGDAFAVSVAKATTSAYAVGTYDWVAFVESATERHQVDAGQIVIGYNFATTGAHDGRSFARTMLDAVEAALLSRASGDQLDLVQAALADRSMQYSPGALMTLRSQLQGEVSREKALQNGTESRRVLVRFGA